MKKIYVLLMMVFAAGVVWGQTSPTAQSIPYSQDFSTLNGSTTSYPAGWQGWRLASSAPPATYNTATPASDVAIAGGNAGSTGGQAYDFNGKIGFLSTGSNQQSLVLGVVTTGKSTIRLSYDAMTIRNPQDASNNYVMELSCQYRVGTSGAFTNITPSVLYQNNTTNQTSTTTAPLNTVSGINVVLPSACDNQAVVQIRWLLRTVSGSAGSRPSFALDNVSVVNEPTTQASAINFTSVADNSFTVNWTNGNGTRRAVFMKETSGAITNPTDGTAYTASANWSSKGTQLGTSGYYCIYDGTGSSVAMTNLASGVVYYVQAFEYNNDVSVTAASINYFTATATNNPNSQVTTSASPTIVVNPASLSGFTYQYGAGPSATQSVAVSGTNLTGAPGNIAVTAPADYEVNDGNGWTSSLNIPYASATLNTVNIDVRLKAGLAVGTYNESVTFAGGGDSKSLSLTGNVSLGTPVALAPTVFTATSFTADWTPGVGGVATPDGYRLDVATTNTFQDASAGVVAGWDFEAGTGAANTGTAANTGKLLSGTNITNVTFNSSGNGGQTARADGWDAGTGIKYWEININTTNYSSLTISSKQRSSSSGPKNFKLQYKIGAGGTYADVPSGTITTADDYTTGVLSGLALPAPCENQSAVYLRWIVTSTTSVSNGTVGAGGASNIDDIAINGTLASTYLPGYKDLPVTGPTQVVTVPGPGTYYYRVRATTGAVTSPNSNVITVVINNQNTAAFRSTTSGDYNSAGTWEFNVSPPSYYTAATQAPALTNNVTINNGHTVTLSSAGNANALTLGGNIVLGANILTVNSVSGGSATGYVQTNGTGVLTVKNVTTATTFPVGNGSSYTPASITNTGTADDFSVNVAAGTPCNTDPNQSVNRVWTITEATAGGSNASITLQWNAGDENPTFIRALCAAVHCAGGVVDIKGTKGAAGGSNPYTQTISGISSFSPFGVTSDNVVLPVGIQYFEGNKQGGRYNLSWKVNCAPSSRVTMTVERSADGRTYDGVYTITADAARCLDAFSFTDAAPLAGTNYYRLKSVDIDGKVAYSSTVVLINGAKGTEVMSIAPNPVVGTTLAVNISTVQVSKMDIVITDMTGKMVSTTTVNLVNGFNKIRIDAAGFAKGTYQLYGITSEGKTAAVRFVKQ